MIATEIVKIAIELRRDAINRFYRLEKETPFWREGPVYPSEVLSDYLDRAACVLQEAQTLAQKRRLDQ